MRTLPQIRSSLREIVFGLEDGLVSTLGAITGIAAATRDQNIVVVSGLVIIAVESLSMAAGTYLSNKSEIQSSRIRSLIYRNSYKPLQDSVFMGISYVVGGFLPVITYLLFPIGVAVVISVVITAVSLFLIGFIKGKIVNTNPIQSGLEMMIVSLSAALVGFAIGKLASVWFPNLQSI